MKNIKYSILILIGVILGGSALSAQAQIIPFTSKQLAPSPLNGYCLVTNGSINSWSTSCGSSSGGSGGGTFSTSTSQTGGILTNHPNNTTDVVTIGSSSTTTAPFWFDPNTGTASINKWTYSTTTAVVCKTASQCPYTTIQSALNAGWNNIYVKNGVYSEQVTAIKSNTIITGESKNAIIQCNGVTQSPCVSSGSFDGFQMWNMAVRELNASLTGVGIDLSNGSLFRLMYNNTSNFATSTQIKDTGNNSFYGIIEGNRFQDPRNCLDFSGTFANDNHVMANRCRPMSVPGSIGYYLEDVQDITLFANNSEATTSTNGPIGVYVDPSSTAVTIQDGYFEQNALAIFISSGARSIRVPFGRFINNTTNITDNSGSATVIAPDFGGAGGATYFNAGNIGVGTTSPFAPGSFVGAGGVVADKYSATSTTATSTFSGSIAINGCTTDNQFCLTSRNGGYPSSDSTGAMARLTNTLNPGSALGIYTNFGSGTTNALVRLFSDNSLNDGSVLSVKQDGIGGAGVFNCTTSDSSAGTECVNITSTADTGLTTLGIKGGTLTHGVVKITTATTTTVTSANQNASAISFVLQNSAQGLHFAGGVGDVGGVGSSTGDFIQARNFDNQTIFDWGYKGQIGVWDSSPDAMVEIVSTTTNDAGTGAKLPYFYVSSSAGADGDIFQINNNGFAKIGNNFIATTTTVCAAGCDYTDIDTAVDTVAASTTILIKNGTYALGAGTITVTGGKTLDIIGESKEGVVITYSGSGSAFIIGDSTTITRNFKLENITIHGTSAGTRGFSFVNVRNSTFNNLYSYGFTSAGNPGQAFRLDGTGGYTGDNEFYNLRCDTSDYCLNLAGTAVNANHFYGFTLRGTTRSISIANANGNSFNGGLVGSPAGTGIVFTGTGDENRVDGVYCESNLLCVDFQSGASDNSLTLIDVESNTTMVTDAGSRNNVTYTGSDSGGKTYFNGGNFGLGTTSPGSVLSIQGNQFIAGNIVSTSTSASIFPYASTTALSVSGLTSGNCVQASTGGLLTTTGSACGSGGGSGFAFPWTPSSDFNQNTNSTTTTIWLKGNPYSLFASSTSVFDYASTTLFSVKNTGVSTAVNITGNMNGYYEANIQNQNNGSSASSDWVATADNGSATTHYIDMGINGSNGAASPFTTQNHGYLYTSDDTLNIGAIAAAADVNFFAGGSATSSMRLKLQSNGNVNIGTSTGYSKLTVFGGGTALGQTLEVANSASTTLFMVWDNGQAYSKGNFGIGSTTPGTALGVVGDEYLTGLLTASRYISTSTLASIFPYASSTALTAINLFSTTATTSNFFGANLSSCNSASNALTWSNGLFGCNTITSSGGNAASKWATTSPIQGVASTAIAPTNAANVSIGTSTPWWNQLFSLASTTAPQLNLIGNSSDSIWSVRGIGNHFYIATSSPTTGATTTTAAMDIDGTSGAKPYFDFATSSPGTGVLNIGNNPATTNGSTTIMMGKLQWDGYDSAGVRRCSFINSAGAMATIAGACNN
jgi:hypothetical protein